MPKKSIKKYRIFNKKTGKTISYLGKFMIFYQKYNLDKYFEKLEKELWDIDLGRECILSNFEAKKRGII